MPEHFTRENKEDDTDYHKQAKSQSQEPVDKADDKEFTVKEIRNAVASMENKTAQGEDGITGDMDKSAFEILPIYITALYNGCLRGGVFPTTNPNPIFETPI
jgi:hypothetical protein